MRHILGPEGAKNKVEMMRYIIIIIQVQMR